MKKWVSLFLFFCMIITLCSCTAKDRNAGKTLRFELDTQPKTLDPLLAQSVSERLIVQNIYEGLMRIGTDGTLLKGAAESYTVDESQKIYTFTLRKGVKWSDGKPLTASDFVFGMRRALLPATKSPVASALFPIKYAREVNSGSAAADFLAVTALDESTLQIELNEPNRDFLRTLATACAMPCREDFFEESAGRYGMGKDTVIANGPFAVRRWNEGKLISLIKNNKYEGEVDARPAAVIFSLDETQEDRILRLKNGEIDLGSIDGQQLQKAVDAGLDRYTDFNTCWAVYLNPSDKVMASSAIRTALAATLDREGYAATLPGYFQATSALIPPCNTVGGSFYRDTVANPPAPAMDAAAAARQYAEAIQSLSTKGSGKTPVAPTITLLCPEDEAIKTLASYAIQQWQKVLGAYIHLKTVPLSQLKSEVAAGSCQMALYPFQSSDNSASTLLNGFASYSRAALPHYYSKDYDALLAGAQSSADDQAIALALSKAESHLTSAAVVIPMAFEASCFIARSEVDGFALSFAGRNIDLSGLGKSDD